MYYVVTDSLAIDFDFKAAEYMPPTDPLAIDMDLVNSGSVAIQYPIPPDFMVSAEIGNVSASAHRVARSGVGYSMTPAQREIRRALRSAEAANLGDSTASGWDKTRVVDQETDNGTMPWGTSPAKDGKAPSGWNKVSIKDDHQAGVTHPWPGSIRPIDGRVAQGFIAPPYKDTFQRMEHASTDKLWTPPARSSKDYIVGETDFPFPFGPYIAPPAIEADFDLAQTAEEQAIQYRTRPVDGGRVSMGWDKTFHRGDRDRQAWDDKPRKGSDVSWDFDLQEDLPDKEPPPDPDIQEVYLYMNASSLRKMPEGIALEFANLSIGLDIDSFSWSLSASILNKSSMDQIRPGPGGPVEVEATVNGYTWRFMVERYSLDQKFPKETYKINGSSLTQLLASPYSVGESKQIDTQQNALQVAQDVLDLTGFSIVWDPSLPDYTIPAGVWGYEDKTPIEVIDELVKAAGGVIVPTLSLSEIRAHHRYREAPPWYWPQIDADRLDFQIPDSMILGLSSQWEPNKNYNGVYISGISAGVAVEVRKNGTAGDIRAPDNVERLNLETQQCRSRGITILGQGGDQEIVTIEIPVPTSGAPGLVIPGQWGEIQDTREPSNSWRALVLSNQVSVSKPGAARAVQQLKLERHHY